MRLRLGIFFTVLLVPVTDERGLSASPALDPARQIVQPTCGGPIIALTGTTRQSYVNNAVPDGATLDLRGWYSDAVADTTNHAVTVGNNVPTTLCVNGGVVSGHIPSEWGWRTVHTFGGHGYRTTAKTLVSVENARIHNVEDGWKPRESTTTKDVGTFPNTGAMRMRHVYMTGIRDDCIEDDEFMPGEIEDSLFDGVWTFLSEQRQKEVTDTIGSTEDPTIRVTRCAVRLAVTNGEEVGGGRWFKWMPRGAEPHRLILTDTVLAVDRQPRLGWGVLDFPPGTAFKGSNFILWLGPTGEYGGAKPPEMRFLEGQTAKNKWNDIRNTWLTEHGYAPRPIDDWNSMDDPVAAPKRR